MDFEYGIMKVFSKKYEERFCQMYKKFTDADYKGL